MNELINTVWWGSLLILTCYSIYIFRIRRASGAGGTQQELSPVSILIAVKNGSAFLEKNLPFWVRQDYPAFEIIIINDHSEPAERMAMEVIAKDQPNVILYHSDRPPGKKHALMLGVEKASHELILVTDVDCHPASPNWIKEMVAVFPNGKVVLGYSPYEQRKGILNTLIRFETLMTAMQYFSWAMLGRPYMGVGRNMLFEKKLFTTSVPYATNANIPYGDDDLFVQAIKSKAQVEVCLQPDSFVYSAPNTKWREWLNQKHRHLSAAHYYAKETWWQPGLYGMALILHWVLLWFVNLTCSPVLIICFIMGLAIRWYRHIQWTGRLGDRDTIANFPLLEPAYALYLACMGLITLVAKKKTWN